MTQFPHDEFDDAPPYKTDEVGKHRAPGAVASTGGAGGGLKWIGLLAALVLVIGAVAWIISEFNGDGETPTADTDDEQTAEETETEQPDDDAEAEDGGDEDGNGEAGGDNGEEDAQEDEDEVNMDYSVIVYNFDGTEGAAGGVRAQLDGAGFNVVSQDNWNQGWTTCGETAPVVVHPPAEEELAQMIADEIGAATCPSEGWSDSEIIAVAVGAESLP